MKKKHLLFLSGSILIIGLIAISIFISNNKKQYVARNNNTNISETTFRGAASWMQYRRGDINGNIDPKDVQRAQKEVKALANLKSNSTVDFDWNEMGPDNIGGRVRAILYDMNNSNIVYAGGVSGGLWRSVTGGQSWNKVLYSGDATNDFVNNLNVSCITQAANGDIYFGTGEYSGSSANYVGSNGNGIWKSTDGVIFTHLESTWSTSNQKDIFQVTNRLAADPSDANKLYAATYKGLRVTTDGGVNWETIPDGISTGNKYKLSRDVKVGTDGTVVASINQKTYISTDGGETFATSTLWPSVSNGRLEFAISPSDPNYIYCQAANPNGTLENIYQSTDKGVTWNVIGPGGYLTFQPLGNQGTYDNIIAVFPNSPTKIIIGGQSTMYTWSPETEWIPVSNGYFDITDYRYVHADHHEIVFHPNYENNHTLLIGTDGGVFISEYDAVAFANRNKNLNITQFYGVAYDGQGHVMGGAQDNGTLYNDFGGNTVRNFVEVSGGDGAFCEMSMLDPRVGFATVYYGSLRRTQEKDKSYYEAGNYFYSNKILNTYWGGLESNIGDPTNYHSGPFVTQVELWESYYDENSIDSVTYTNDSIWISIDDYDNYYASWEAAYINFSVDTVHFVNANNETSVIAALTIGAGETIYAKSQIYDRPLAYVLPSTLYPGEQVKVKDTYQAMLAIPLRNPNSEEWNLLLTRKPLNFNVLAAYQPWAFTLPMTLTGGTWAFRDLQFSKDGEYLYFAFNSTLYRISNLSNSRTKDQLDVDGPDYNLDVESIYSFSNTVNSIAVDPNNPDRVMVLLSGFGGSNVYLSSNATSASPSFQNKQGSGTTKLPSMPVFSGVINKGNGNQVIVGTEYGIYSTEDITAVNPEWVDQSGLGMGHVLTMQIRQQLFDNSWQANVENDGYIYVATHGRGIFSSDAWKGPEAIDEPNQEAIADNLLLKVYPNPISQNATINFTNSSSQDVWLNIYDLQGKLVKKDNIGKFSNGEQKVEIDFNDLNSGTYILSLKNKNIKASAKIIKL